MRNFKFILIISSCLISNIYAMQFDLDSVLDNALDQYDNVENTHVLCDGEVQKFQKNKQLQIQDQEIKRDLEDVSENQSMAPSSLLLTEDSDQELRNQIELCSPHADNESLNRLVNFVKLSRKKDLATGLALANGRHADKVFVHQGKIISHEDRIANLEKLIHQFEESLNQAIGGFNQGRELLLGQLNELKAEVKILRELAANTDVHVAILNTNQENQKQTIDHLTQRLTNVENNLNQIQGIINMLKNPLEAIRVCDEYYARKSELIFLASLGGYMLNDAVIRASGATPILGLPLKYFISAVSLPLKVTLAANLAYSSYKLSKKYAHIKNYKKTIIAGASSLATAATGFFGYKKYLQAAKFLSQMPLSF